MGANLATEYKLRVSLDKMTYSPGEMINGTFSFDFGKDQFKKKNLCINIMRGNSTKNNYNYKNINSPSMKSSYNTFITNNSSNQNKKNTAKKNYSQKISSFFCPIFININFSLIILI